MPRVAWEILDRGRWRPVDREGLVNQMRTWRADGATYTECTKRIRPAMTPQAARLVLHIPRTDPPRTWRIRSGSTWVAVSKVERNQAIARWVQEASCSLDECARRIRPALSREGVRQILVAAGVEPLYRGHGAALVTMVASGSRLVDAVRHWAAARGVTRAAVAAASGLPIGTVTRLLSGRPGPWAATIDRLATGWSWTVDATPQGGEHVRKLHPWVCDQIRWENIAATAAATGCSRSTLYHLRDGTGARRWMGEIDAVVAALGAVLVVRRD